MIAGDDTGGDVWTVAWAGYRAWRLVEARFEASTFVLKVEETPALWPEEIARAGTPETCYDHVEPML